MNPVSKTIGRYQIREQVGTGSHGTVYRCFDPILKREVAIKLSAANLNKDELQSVVKGFYREAEISAQLHHANTITVYDVGKEQTQDQQHKDITHQYYLVMELVNGVSLKDHLNQHGRLSVEETLKIISECCKALDYIHYKGILHRDIKPTNIIYNPVSESLKIIDFSISDYADNPSNKQIGTLPYSSPEYFVADRNLTYQSDLFSLGSVMYQLLTGSCPFKGESVDEVASRIVSSNPKPIRKYRDDIPMQVEFIVLKAMSKLQRDRIQSAVEFLDMLSLALKTIDTGKNKPVEKHYENTKIDEYLTLRNNGWLSGFSPDQIDNLVRSGQILNYAADEYLIKEGDIAKSFYTLLEGQVEVLKDEQTINRLNPGACFGELGHLTKTQRRTASVKATTPVKVLAVETKKLLSMPPESQAGFYRSFLTITMERLLDKNDQNNR